MKKMAQDLMQNVETSGSCNPTDPECFLKEYFPKHAGLDELFSLDISYLGSSYSTVRDIYNEYVDKSLSGEDMVYPDTSSAEEAVKKMEGDILKISKDLEKVDPNVLEVVLELLENPDISDEELEKKINSGGFELEEEPTEDIDFKKEKLSKINRSKGFQKTSGKKNKASLIKRFIEVTTPVKAVIAARYAMHAKKLDIKDASVVANMSRFSLKRVFGEEAGGIASALIDNMLKTPLRTFFNLMTGGPLKAVRKAESIGAIESFLGNFWAVGSLTAVFTMLSALTLNLISGMLLEVSLGDVLMLIAEMVVGVAAGVLVGAALFVAVRAFRTLKRVKKVIDMVKRVEDKVLQAGRRIAYAIKLLDRKFHKDLCEKSVSWIPFYTAADADRIMSSIVKKNYLKLLQLKKFLIQNGI